jgi:type I restriction enzyme M protein
LAVRLDVDWGKVGQLDEWARKRYFVLVNELTGKRFTVEDVDNVLRKHGLGLENVGKLLSSLIDAGLVEANTDPHDARRKTYSLSLVTYRSAPTLAGMAKPVGRDELIRLLKSGADLIRTAVDYKTLLLFLFFKSISDKWNSIVQKYRREEFSEEEAYILANSEYLALYDEVGKKLYTWNEVTERANTINELANAIIAVSRMNQGLADLQNLVEVLGFLGFISEDNMHILNGLVQLFNAYDFSTVDYDVLGDAYQWVLSYFAPERAKEGATYTPRGVIKLLVNILDPEDGSVILDPACGSGAMLIEAYNHVKQRVSGEPSLELVGQERNEIIAVIAKMNMVLHGLRGYTIHVGDSLRNPRFEEADYVIANPPWNQDGYDESALGEPSVKRIYTYFLSNGFPPKSSADWAWIPPLVEQRTITNILSSVDEKKEHVTKYKDKVKKIRYFLLDALISGRVRVKNA